MFYRTERFLVPWSDPHMGYSPSVFCSKPLKPLYGKKNHRKKCFFGKFYFGFHVLGAIVSWKSQKLCADRSEDYYNKIPILVQNDILIISVKKIFWNISKVDLMWASPHCEGVIGPLCSPLLNLIQGVWTWTELHMYFIMLQVL